MKSIDFSNIPCTFGTYLQRSSYKASENMETLVKFANEVNNEWIGGYSADVIGEHLVVSLNGKEVAQMNKKFQVVGDDQDAVDQLEYMANR